MNLDMTTPTRLEMAKQAAALRDRAQFEACKYFALEARVRQESPEQLVARYDLAGGYFKAWIERYHKEKRELREAWYAL